MDFHPHSFSEDDVSYLAPSWEEMDKLAFLLAQKIRKTSKKIDRIVTLAKGGWPMTRSMVDYLEVSKVASLGIKFYTGINKQLDEPEIYQDLPVSVKGERLLLFDDVVDTGGSFIFAKDHLLQEGATEVQTASLFYKPHSQFMPDFYGAETDAWIVFPYDAVEMIKILGKKWWSRGCDVNKCQARFRQLGFRREVITAYRHFWAVKRIAKS